MGYFSAGQYIPGHSYLHKMEPFPKLLGFFALLAAIILSNSPSNYLLITGVLLWLVLLSKIDLRTIFLPLYRLRAFFIVILLMNVLFFDPENPIFKVWIFSISRRGALQGLSVVLRTTLAMLAATILTSVTPVMGLVDAIKFLLAPLEWLHIPTDEVALILGISLQFIPTIYEETDRIRKAQAARGASFMGGNLKERALGIIPLVVPVFLSTFRRADELSTAMEARCYPGKKRRQMKKLSLSTGDFLVLIFAFSICILQILF